MLLLMEQGLSLCWSWPWALPGNHMLDGGPSQEGALFGWHTSSCPRRMYPVLFARGSTWNAAFHCHYCSSLFYAVIYIRRQMKWTLTKARRVITQTRSLRKSCLRKLMPCQNLRRRNHSENSDSTCQYLQCEMRWWQFCDCTFLGDIASTQCLDVAYFMRVLTFCVCVCLCVGYNCETSKPCKTARPIKMHFVVSPGWI